MAFDTDDLRGLYRAFADRMQAERDHLCQLDGEVGDADHGIAMAQGMAAAARAAAEADGTLQDLCNAAAKGFLNAVGASSGPLYATAFLRAGKALGPVAAVPLDQVPQVIVAMREGIVHRGKAVPGQKTMLDAWHPAAEAVLQGLPLADVTQAAWHGAHGTRDMIATLGRTERLGARSVGHLDPGAVSAAMLIETLAAVISQAQTR
jgi:phosphoenolpyruvate---glycerone phosphotransferase subunit DhaL